ncbi:MAG: methyl-accepting chemotaxis protein [Myxococcaceae bacterium]
MIDPNSWKALRTKFIVKTLLISVPASLVGPYLVALILDLRGEEIRTALLIILPPDILLVVGGLQFVVAGWLCRAALAEVPNEPPGARLTRILALPRKLELFSLTAAYGLGAPIFTLAACLTFHRSLMLVPLGALIGLCLAAIVGIPTTLLFQTDVLPHALEEFHRAPKHRPTGSGVTWPRQSWYLPYAFSVLLVSTLISGGVVLVKTFNQATQQIFTGLGTRTSAEVTDFVRGQLDELATSFAVPMMIICGALLGFFVVSGWLMAKREQAAARAIEESLHSLAAGTPRLPAWVSTDEIGDVAQAVGAVSVDMKQVFEQLKLMAGGDLAVELKGDSGLVTNFRDSQQGLRLIVEQMRVLSKGDVANGGSITGDLGKAFSQLSAALGATIAQAKTIAHGDLRKDMEMSGELGAAIHQMTKNLRAMVGQTQDVGAQISKIVLSLRSATTQLSAATTEQVSALTETANTMAEMSQTSAASAERCGEMIKQGNSASNVVDEGRNGAAEAGQAMNAISASLGKVSAASGVLAEKVGRVDSIIETVGFLADQSSTLAINASIEASRAGDSGRGFAAVAREMRTLASDSRKATAQIREILQEIRQKTVQVDTVVAAGSSTVEEGVRQVNRLGDAVSQLGVTVHDAVGLMRQVESSARQHQAGVSQVSQALRSMQVAAESIRDGARMLSDLSEQEHALATKLKETAGAYQLLPSGEAQA